MIYLALIAIGTLAGFINSLAGGGSLLTLPLLIFMGLPPVVANGTNRLAIVFAAVTGTYNFRKQGYFEVKKSITFGIPAVIGSVIGSSIAVNLSGPMFNQILGVIMLVMLFIILIKPHKYIKSLEGNHPIIGFIAFFFVGLYGGIIQAGVGFLIIMTLTLVTHDDLVRINSIKILVVLIYTIPAILVFYNNGQIDFFKGLILAIGNSTGAIIGSRMQVKKGEKIVKWVLSISILLMALRLLGIIQV